MAVQKVELHSRAQDFAQVSEVAPLLRSAVIDRYLPFVSVGPDGILILADDDATHVALVGAQSLFVLPGRGWEQPAQLAGHIHPEYRRYKQHHRPHIVEPAVLGRKGSVGGGAMC